MQRNIQTFAESLKLRPTAIISSYVYSVSLGNAVIYHCFVLCSKLWVTLKPFLKLFQSLLCYGPVVWQLGAIGLPQTFAALLVMNNK